MNYLAHCFLSGTSTPLLIGNFIADSVKGKKFNSFTPGIRAGIKLHRAIDHFTDHYPTVVLSKKKLTGEVGKYAPVLLDLYYDHFLALDWFKYSDETLSDYVQKIYTLIESEKEYLPEKLKNVFYYMRRYNWLLNYGSLEGIDSALKGMSQRVKFKPQKEFSVATLLKDYNWYKENFDLFFPHIIEFTQKEINKIGTE